MTPLLYLFSVLCSSGQSALGKQYARRGGKSLTFNINKALIGALLFLIVGIIGGFSLHLETMLFAVGYGVLLCASMHTGFKALSTGPMALTSMIASFSLLIPFSFGIIFWGESLTILKLVGIALLLLSIFLINSRKESGFSAKWLFYALATLLLNGFCSVIQKLHQLRFPTLYKTEFMFWSLLCVSLILTLTHMASKTEKARPRFSLLGMASGVGNCVANYIVLYLSATENASVLFPIISVINIIAVWLFGIVFFKEKLRALQSVGLVIGIASVILLKI